MFTVLGCMLVGIIAGFILRKKQFKIIQKVLFVLIWLLLFLLGAEIGSNPIVVRQTGKLGFDALLIGVAGTLGSIIAAGLLWKWIKPDKSTNEK
ncbi:MAG: LysO family transporter [Bacteroidales bacterium]|jgi:uncharacterized membrane protein YbjE (DUF340 family)|nr:LysO family transporter [Bacteroidales bacterium]